MLHARANQGTRDRVGGGLPLYPSTDMIAQNRRDLRSVQLYTWISPQSSGIPFQVGRTCTGATVFRIVSATGAVAPITLSIGLLDQDCYDGTKMLITYDGGAFGVTLDAGVYYFLITLSTGEVLSSDFFYACDGLADDSILITWSNSKSWCGGTYYGGSYVGKMWCNTQFARPRMEYTEEVNDDGFGGKIPLYQRMEEVYGFDVIATDSQIAVMTSISMCDTVTVTAPEGGGAVAVNTFRASDTGERKDALAVIEVSFKVDYTENTQIDEPLFAVGAC